MRILVAFLVVGALLLMLAVGVWVARRRPPEAIAPIPAGVLKGANVLLVTIDTLRADRVGAFGSDRGLTPTIDRFAKEGLRFERTYAHVPLTLPSHASLLTGAYPTRNGVHDNASFHLAAGVPTISTALKAGRYRTGAFVGAFVLDARFGLNAGFDIYDDRLLGGGPDLEMLQRTADQVLAPAYDWIAAPATTPWFAWVHLYDPHEPYTPPEPYLSRYITQPYDGEIAYTDGAIGRFVERLRSAGALQHTLVIITADHGESLGEHGERTHGLFAYDATIRVPLLLWAPPTIHPGIFSGTMRLVDVVPTILDLVGLTPLPSTDGRSVRPFIAGEQAFDEPTSYFEALNANFTRRWAPLRGVVRRGLKLIDLPIPELYDLLSDPGEQKNLYVQRPQPARDLEAKLDAITRAASGPGTPAGVDAETEARLRSLGYVVGSTPGPARKFTAADDPKRLVPLDVRMNDAMARWLAGDAARAVEALKGVIAERPDMTIAYDRLAFVLRASGHLDDAVRLLDEAARAGHADKTLLRSLGGMLRDAGDLRRSASVLEDLVRTDASDVESADSLAQTWTRMGRGRDAEELFTRVLALSPNAAETWNNLGALYLTQQRTADAIGALAHAVAVNPSLAGAHNTLGVAYARAGQLERAVAEWRIALQLRPGYPDARDNLASVTR